MRDSTLHITVATGWSERRGLDVGHETELVKSALLYADRVTLASPRVAFLAMGAGVLNMDDAQRAEAIVQMASNMPGQADLVMELRKLERKKHKTVDEHYRLKAIREYLNVAGDELNDKVNSLLTEAGVAELALAIDAGILDLHPLGIEQGSTDHLAENLATLLVEVVSPGASTFPLLDESTNGWLKAMVNEGIVPGSDVHWGTEPTLGTRWIGEMQAFPKADMSAVIELREELHEPLVRYRAAIIGVSVEFDATPIDEDFEREASQAYRERVEPELLALTELARERRVASLLKHAVTSGAGRKVLGAGLGFVGAEATDIPRLLGAVVGAGADVASEVLVRRKTLGAEQRRSGFFYLYEAERRLEK